jgi:uncharacterized membrane-anchored protein
MTAALVLAGFFDQGFFRGILMVAITVCWAFALYDLATRKLDGRKKAVWFVLILIFPIVGAFTYILTRPSVETIRPDSIDSVAMQDPRATMLQPPGI